ncbi:MAG: transcriptional repressor [Myxococcales bacterium]|nr:transcriptional repressor [Myxococcales bacterium]
MRGRALTSVEAIRSLVREAGLRVTAPRVAVIQRLVAAGGPVTHAEIADALAPDGWDRATLYRNLSDLTEAGLLRRTDMGDHVWRFELTAGDDAGHDGAVHPHFVCTDCGGVTCLPEGVVELHAAGRGVPRSLRAKGLEIQVKGRCDRCA